MAYGGSTLENIEIICGTSNPQLALAVCNSMRMNSSRVHIETFADGEVCVEIIDNLRSKDVYILQPLCRPVNQNLMELTLLADAAQRSAAKSICAVVPYICYSRQDRRPRGTRTPISARVVANIIESAGIDHLVTIDLHAEQIQGFYTVPVDNLYASNVLLGDMTRLVSASQLETKPVIVAPDVGGIARARAMAKMLDSEVAMIDKRRPKPNVAEIMHIIGEVKDRHCIIVDDMIDTAGTLVAASNSLLEKGAKSVRAYCTHLLLSGRAVERISESDIVEVVGTDTIPLEQDAQQCDKIRVLSIAELLAEALHRIEIGQSVGALFGD